MLIATDNIDRLYIEHNIVMYMIKSKYSLDTCVIRKILENPNYLSCMKVHVNFEDSRIFLSETAIWEIEKQLGKINPGLTTDAVVQKIGDGLNADITVLENSKETKILADDLLLANQPDLHHPDNLHLAFSMTQETTLLSCDSDLVRCCKREGHPCINPNKLGWQYARVRGSRFNKVVKENSRLAPGQKMTWRSLA